MPKKHTSPKRTRKSSRGIALVPVLIVIALGLLGVFVVPKIMQKTTPKTAEVSQTSEPDAEGWQTYQQNQYGYSIRHPKGWSVDDTKFPSTQEILVVEDGKNAMVKINAYQDKSINSEETVMKSIAAFKQKISSDPNIKLQSFKDSFEDKVGGFIAQGEQTIDGTPFVFINKGLVAVNNRILIFHGAAKKPLAKEYGETIIKIMSSFSLDKNE